MLERIYDKLDSNFPGIAGFVPSDIVDVDFEIGPDSKVGIRIDNNFGVVEADDAVLFADALAFATKVASEFQYLGHEVVEEGSECQ